MADAAPTIRGFLASHREDETRFLAELVKVPSDNPPGDCAAHADARGRAARRPGLHGRAASGAGRAGAGQRHDQPAPTSSSASASATGPVVALNAHGDVVPPGEGWTHDPFGAEIVDGWMYGRGVAVSKSDFATYAFALLALQAAAAAGRDARRHGRAAPHLRRGGRRRDRPALADRAGHQQARPRPRRRLLLRRRQRAQWLPASRGAGRRPLGARRHALDRHRRAGGRDPHPGRALRLAQDAGGAPLGHRGHRQPAADDRADQGRHQHQRRARPRHLPSRPAHGAGGVPEAVEAELTAGDRARPPRTSPRPRSRCGASCWPARWSRSEGGRRLTEILCRRATEIMGEPVAAKGVPLYTDARHYAEKGIPIVLYGAGPAHDPGGQRAPRRRAPAARRPAQGDRGGGPDAAGPAGRSLAGAGRVIRPAPLSLSDQGATGGMVQRPASEDEQPPRRTPSGWRPWHHGPARRRLGAVLRRRASEALWPGDGTARATRPSLGNGGAARPGSCTGHSMLGLVTIAMPCSRLSIHRRGGARAVSGGSARPRSAPLAHQGRSRSWSSPCRSMWTMVLERRRARALSRASARSHPVVSATARASTSRAGSAPQAMTGWASPSGQRASVAWLCAGRKARSARARPRPVAASATSGR